MTGFTPATYAASTPDKAAVIYGNGEHVETYGDLELRSRRIAHLLRRAGFEPGDCLAVYLGNDDQFFDVFWACHRIGIYFTPVNWHLQEDEVRYIVDNCDAKGLLAHADFGAVAAPIAAALPRLELKLAVGGEIEGFESLRSRLGDVPQDLELSGELEGSFMLYSSGTTGRPKGVRRMIPGTPPGDPASNAVVMGLAILFGLEPSDRYLSPAPLYHAAPLVFSSVHHRIGATTIVMRRFDPEEALRTIQDQRATTSQWVPTHFRKLLQLPAEVRARYDLSSLRMAIHAAAPCPIALKQQMIDWWGEKIVEYYGGTEGGGTKINSDEWLKHPGSVGRHWAGGTIYILDESGQPIREPRKEGAVYFEAPPAEVLKFRYYKDDAKTAGSYRGELFTIGDIGYLDEEGYLYLTDRQSNMIISGGVNIYPQETENILIMHPKVQDVAVIGVPNEEMGEEVKAVVIAAPGVAADSELEAELIAFCRARLAHYKCPRSVDFVSDLPRTETGKMAKRKLRARYWGEEARLV